jgi:hypothetical protein
MRKLAWLPLLLASAVGSQVRIKTENKISNESKKVLSQNRRT